MARYSTALSHLILGCCSAHCFALSSGPYQRFAYGSIVANSIIGIWRWGVSEGGDTVDKVYEITTLVQNLLAVPCLAAGLWLKNDHPPEIAYAHVIVPCIPLLMYLTNQEDDLGTKDAMALLSVLSMGCVSFLHDNLWGMVTAASYAVDYFVLFQQEIHEDIPPLDLFNYGLCFVVIFSLNAFGGGGAFKLEYAF